MNYYCLCKKNPAFFKAEGFTCIKSKNGYLIQYVGNPSANANTSILVRIDGVIEAKSARASYSQGLYGTNEFLINLMPNQKYIIDDAITVETDALGRIVKSSGDYNKLIAGSKDALRNSDLQKQFGRALGGQQIVSHPSQPPAAYIPQRQEDFDTRREGLPFQG